MSCAPRRVPGCNVKAQIGQFAFRIPLLVIAAGAFGCLDCILIVDIKVLDKHIGNGLCSCACIAQGHRQWGGCGGGVEPLSLADAGGGELFYRIDPVGGALPLLGQLGAWNPGNGPLFQIDFINGFTCHAGGFNQQRLVFFFECSAE